MRSYVFTADTSRISTATTMIGTMSGTVMCRRLCQPLAPSTLAASRGSWGSEDSPA